MNLEKRIQLLFLVNIIIFLLVSCGTRETPTEKEDVISDYYTAENIPLEVDSPLMPVLTGKKVYYILKDDEGMYTICKIDIDDRQITEKALSIENHPFNLLNFTADLDENLYYILTVNSGNNAAQQWDRYILKHNAQGEEEYFQKVTEDIGLSFLHMQADDQGILSFRYDKIYQFDKNGLYLGNEKYESDSEESIKFYLQKSSLEKFGIDSSAIEKIAFLEDGRIEVLTKDKVSGFYGLWVLTPSDISINENKTELVLGVLENNNMIRSLTADFNKNRQDIYVTIQEYKPSGSLRTSEEALSVLMGDFLSGKGPDLIALSLGENHALLAEQGMLEDLQPYMDQSSVICSDEIFLDGVCELGKYGELRYAIPMRFSFQTLVGKTALLGEPDGWTVEKLAKLSEQHPESLLIDPASKSYIFSLCCIFQAEMFIDKEAGKCHFDSPEFYEILEFANTFALDKEPDSISDTLKYQDDRVLLMEADLYSVDSYLDICQAFGMAPLSFIGYPTQNGSSCHMLSQCNEMYGISSCSKHKQEAWQFVEYYAQWDAENMWLQGFPTDNIRLEQWLAEQTNSGKLEQPMAETLKELLTHIAKEAATEIVWGEEADILYEELYLYFNGQRTLDEMIHILENRISLFLNEGR